jgi:PAS domain S-box-containing protein
MYLVELSDIPKTSPVFLAGGGELGGLIAAFDWSVTALGPIAEWPLSRRSAVSILVRSHVPMVSLWGPDGVMIYNDAYAAFAGGRHPDLLGQKVLSGGWPEVAQFNANVLKVCLAGGTLAYRNEELTLHRSGYPEQVWMDLDYSPVPDDEGRPAGVIAIVVEKTKQVAAERLHAAAEARGRLEAERVQLALSAGAIIGTWFWDLPTDQFTIDAAFAQSFGLDATLSHRGVSLQQVISTVHPADRDGLIAAINEVIARGGAYAHQYRVQREDGIYYWIEANGRVELAADGTPLRFPGVLLDISARRAANEARLSSEARLRFVVEEAKDHAILTTDPSGVVTSWSPGAEAIFGWPGTEIVGRTSSILFTPEDLAAGVDERELQMATATGYASDERWHLRKDGRRVFMNGGVRPLPADADGQPQGYMKIARDETERRRTDEALRQLNADLEKEVLKRSHVGGKTWQLSPEILGVANADGIFESSNPAWLQVLGWSQEEISKTPFFDLIHPDDAAKTRAAMDGLRRGEPVLRFENRYRRKDGLYRWLSWVAVPDGMRFYCSARDITDEVAVTTERDGIFELSRDLFGVATFDGYLKSINPAWSVALGRSEAEILGRPFSEIIHPDDLAETLSIVATLQKGEPVQQFQIRLLKADGSSISFAWLATPDVTPGTGIFYTVGRDITNDLAAAAELRDVQAALVQSQKMEAVGQLTGGIAHDFNNLLAGIVGSLELIQKRVTQQGLVGFERHLGIAQGSAQRAASLTQRLLAFSRRQTLDPKPLNVNKIIAGVEDLVRRSVGPTIEVETVGAVGLWVIKIDGAQLENAILNLAINARDAMPHGGRITIETANKWLDDRAAKARDLVSGQYISVCVTDSGTGMTAEVMERAFDPFFTTKPLGQGTGLGLSMIHGFVRQSGGQVRIYSEMGHGTTVCLYFPRFSGTAEDDGPADVEPELEQGQGETVLVIDDEEPIRMLISDVLAEAGYRILEATDGPSGLKVLQSDTRIDLLITDVGLPGGFNGRQVADAARLGRPDLKVLFITGYAENAVVGNGHLAPGMQVITKPFPMTTLALRVREIIES